MSSNWSAKHMKLTSWINNVEQIQKKRTFDYSKLDTFHRAVYPILIVAQCFGIMPLEGVKNPDPSCLRFNWKSFRMLFTITYVVAAFSNWLLFLNRLLLLGITAKNIVGLIFFACSLLTCVIFLNLAYKWPQLLKDWIHTELIFLTAPYKTPKIKLRTRIRLAGAIIFTLCIIEHGMYLLSVTNNFHMTWKLCNVTYEATWKGYFLETFPHIFDILPYNVLLTFPVLFINIASTFIWNYMDLFVMMISLGIKIRFEQLYVRFRSKQNVNASFLTTTRLDYMKLCDLLELIDGKISHIVLLSCVNNLYFICYQLLNIFNKLRWNIDYMYFWFSLLYLIGRTIGIFLCASTIHDESRKPLLRLRNLPSICWNTDAERFVQQVSNQCVALSGMKFFHITRRLLFGMAGTVVTYELVLLQFDEPNRIKGLLPLCG